MNSPPLSLSLGGMWYSHEHVCCLLVSKSHVTEQLCIPILNPILWGKAHSLGLNGSQLNDKTFVSVDNDSVHDTEEMW